MTVFGILCQKQYHFVEVLAYSGIKMTNEAKKRQ